MNDTMERQESTAVRGSEYFDYNARAYEGRRGDVRQSAPDYTRNFGYYQPQQQSAPDYARRDGYNDGYNGYYNGGYNNANAGYTGYDNGYRAPENESREAYRTSFDNRYNYEAPVQAAPVYDTSSYDFDAYSMKKEGTQKKAMRLNTKAKVLIALYFAIIAIVVTLVLVNVVIGGSEAAATEEPSAYTEDAAMYFVSADGTEVALDSQGGASYTYDTQTNSFDEFCDWLGEQVG